MYGGGEKGERQDVKGKMNINLIVLINKRIHV